MLTQSALNKSRMLRLAVMLLAGIFLFSSNIVYAGEYPTVSSGDTADISVPESLDESDIVPYLSNTTAPFNQVQTYLFKDSFAPVSSIAYLIDSGLVGYCDIWLKCTFNYNFILRRFPDAINQISFDYDFYVVVQGKKYYPYARVGNEFYFYIVDSFIGDGRIGFGYDGYAACEAIGYGSTGSLSNKDMLTINSHVAVDVLYLYSRGPSYYDLFYQTFLKAAEISANLLNFSNNQRQDLTNIFNLVNGFRSDSARDLTNIYNRITALQTDMNSNAANIYIRMGDLYNNMIANLTAWFNRQHDDLVNLLQQTTQGFDNSEGEAINDKLSGSLGGMENTESAISNEVSNNLGNFNIGDYYSFTDGLVSGLSLVRSFTDSFFEASGEFKTVVSVIFSMAFLSIIVGLWRFVRK